MYTVSAKVKKFVMAESAEEAEKIAKKSKRFLENIEYDLAERISSVPYYTPRFAVVLHERETEYEITLSDVSRLCRDFRAIPNF
jgi:hypothetical protein